MGYGYGRAGRRAEAEQALRDLEAMSRKQFVQASFLAVVYIGLDDRQQAFRYLEQALDEKASSMAFLRVDATFDPLRSDPRFATLLARVGLSDQDIERQRVNRK
jgi:hypothetical protein